jgi:predicted DCC family thiol-disulfide oxidoreductase YuxK
MNPSESKILIQFDGYCLLCSRTVRFLLKADQKKRFIFQTISDNQDNPPPETVVVIDGDQSFRYFDAVLKLADELGGMYRIVNVFRILPQKWRKNLYLWIARNRYRWIGKRKTCYLPSASELDRFISKSKSSFSN